MMTQAIILRVFRVQVTVHSRWRGWRGAGGMGRRRRDGEEEEEGMERRSR